MSRHSKVDVVRAWKDPEYRARLSASQLAALPPNPAGQIELAPAELNFVAGGSAATELAAPAGQGDADLAPEERGGSAVDTGPAADLVTPALKTYVCVFCCSQVSKVAFNFSAPRS